MGKSFVKYPICWLFQTCWNTSRAVIPYQCKPVINRGYSSDGVWEIYLRKCLEFVQDNRDWSRRRRHSNVITERAFPWPYLSYPWQEPYTRANRTRQNVNNVRLIEVMGTICKSVFVCIYFLSKRIQKGLFTFNSGLHPKHTLINTSTLHVNSTYLILHSLT